MRVRNALAVVAITIMLASYSDAGGPLIVAGGRFDPAVDGHAVAWNTSSPVSYRTASAGGLGKLDNASATARVQKLFQVWEDVPTAKVRFQNIGPIQPTGDYPGGAVDTIDKFAAVFFSCDSGVQTPIIFDAGGRLFDALFGPGSGIIGFAGPCQNFDSSGHMLSGLAVLNGKWIDGNLQNGELSDNQFDQAFVHEFGHLIGLDHSQISVGVLGQSRDQCDSMMLAALPVMFPFLHCQARLDAGLPVLSADDEAWVSMLYPETVDDAQNHHVRFDSVYGIISGDVVFQDKESLAQGMNVLAVDTSGGSTIFSVVSGYRFTGNPGGQHVTGNNVGDGGFGSHAPLLAGSYQIPVRDGSYNLGVESINPGFVGGSSVGPLFPINIPNGGFPPANPIRVSAGDKVTGIDIVLRNEDPRFDQFEGK